MFRNFRRGKKETKEIPESERLITEKNEWGDYKVKGLQIKQLAKDKEVVDLNKDVSTPLYPLSSCHQNTCPDANLC